MRSYNSLYIHNRLYYMSKCLHVHGAYSLAKIARSHSPSVVRPFCVEDDDNINKIQQYSR